MGYALLQVPRNCPQYFAYRGVFSEMECGAILALGVALGPKVAMIGSGGAAIVDPKKRVSELRWIEWHQTNDWLFKKLENCIMAANASYGFHLSGMYEPLQLTRYIGHGRKKTSGHYDWHEDHGEGGSFELRKLSLVVPLSKGHKGGRFRMLHNDVPEQEQGTVIVFPSYKTHCVEPVTDGERWSLVGWITGPPFA